MADSLESEKPFSHNSDLSKQSNHQDYLDWDEYFMGIAFLAAKRSNDPVTPVGACIVDEDKKVIGVGYNDMPDGCNNEDFLRNNKSCDISERAKFYVCHAEHNALLNSNRTDLKNCSIYVSLFPCIECAKIIIRSGMKRVFYVSTKLDHANENEDTKRLLDVAKIDYSQFMPKNDRIVIEFKEIDWDTMSQEAPPAGS